ncbi:methyltransferase domain-containing protein [Streptomyces sp. MS19]|uniref:methyltransferase domain-containing protein n=1 Tax=Streptomyces sp. MS19 TaxID=3385972 RepID=UPI00399F9516
MPQGTAPEWAGAFRALPRALFLPDTIWPFDGAPRPAVSRALDPEGWHAAAVSDAAVVTQWDDGRHTGRAPGRTPTSSASAPPLVARMLAALDAAPGARVLEIGTGTGWNAALLSHRLGDDAVTTVEIDPRVAAHARDALRRAGRAPRVITGDGARGVPEGAPYDRLIATCGMRHVPGAWIGQTWPSGVVLLPWGTPYSRRDALLRLTVDEDGRATGRFLQQVEFMKLRADRHPLPAYPDGLPMADRETDAWPPADDWHPFVFAAGLLLADAAHAVERHPDGLTQWLYDLRGTGWTAAVRRDSAGPGVWVRQAGGRALWDELTAAYDWWTRHGRPGVERFGVSVDARGGVAVWLDEPEQVVEPVMSPR